MFKISYKLIEDNLLDTVQELKDIIKLEKLISINSSVLRLITIKLQELLLYSKETQLAQKVIAPP